MKILEMSEFMQLETGISISRYFPANGTAGLERYFVSGYNREPLPPPSIIANMSSIKHPGNKMKNYFAKP